MTDNYAIPLHATRVPIHPAEYCCAIGCGDAIKGLDPEGMMLEVTWSDGTVTYLEDNHSCISWFEDGHPDHPYSGYGQLYIRVGDTDAPPSGQEE